MKYLYSGALGVVLGLMFATYVSNHMPPVADSKPSGSVLTVKQAESYVNDGDAWDIQPAGGYRLVQPTYNPKYEIPFQFVGIQ